MAMRSLILCLLPFIYICLVNAGIANNAKIWCLGNGCSKDVSTNTTAGVVLMGGGTDTTEAFEWQIKHANKGDFVVLRTSGDDAYNQWILDLSVGLGAKLNSVTTILFRNKASSSDPAALAILNGAEAIFLAGNSFSF